jgi:hypothetical protein
MSRSHVTRMVVVGVVVAIGFAVVSTRHASSHMLAAPIAMSDIPSSTIAAPVVPAVPTTTSTVMVAVGDDALSNGAEPPPLSAGASQPVAKHFANATQAQLDAVAAAFERARRVGVPNAPGDTVAMSVCTGGTGMEHWGYFNNGANGGAVPEPDGAVVPLGALCINPVQPDVFSTVLHELGHKYFWDQGLWEYARTHFGGSETAAECFAKIYGATVFGEGGCPDALADRMRAQLHL